MKIMQFINYIKSNKISKWIFSFIFPQYCTLCEERVSQGALFCNNHYKLISYNQKPNCEICSKKLPSADSRLCISCLNDKPYYDSSTIIFNYSPTIASLILNLKYCDTTFFIKNLAAIITKRISTQNIDIICPVPLHKNRLRQRKYNQSALLAKFISKEMRVKFIANLIIRKKFNNSQEGLNKSQRLENVKNNFNFNEKYLTQIKNKNILIVDDVIASGATVNECSKILKKSGCSKVNICAIALSESKN